MRATFQNPNNALIQGEFLTAKLYANKPSNVPIVPVTAVQENQAGKFVYKLDEKDLPQLTYIKTKGQSGDAWIVEDGVKKGDRIVTDGIQKLTPGRPVTIVSKEEMKKIESEENLSEKQSEETKK